MLLAAVAYELVFEAIRHAKLTGFPTMGLFTGAFTFFFGETINVASTESLIPALESEVAVSSNSLSYINAVEYNALTTFGCSGNSVIISSYSYRAEST